MRNPKSIIPWCLVMSKKSISRGILKKYMYPRIVLLLFCSYDKNKSPIFWHFKKCREIISKYHWRRHQGQMGTVKGADAAHSAKTQFLEVIWRLSRQQNKQQPFDSIFFFSLINTYKQQTICNSLRINAFNIYLCVIFILSSM